MRRGRVYHGRYMTVIFSERAVEYARISIVQLKAVDLVCSLDRYGILMIPSSTLAFQFVCAVIAFLSIVTFGMTVYLLGFHVYICKCTRFVGHIRSSTRCTGCYGMSTYDYVVNRRHDRTVDQTLSEFNQMTQQQNIESAILSKIPQQKVCRSIRSISVHECAPCSL